MRIFIHGNDKGNAVLLSLIIIMIFSYMFIAFVPRIYSMKNFAGNYKTKVLEEIEKENKEAIESYDLY